MKELAIIFFHLMALATEQTIPVTSAELNQSLQQANFDLKPTTVAPFITIEHVITNYKKQDAGLLEGWLRQQEKRPEIAEYRANLQRSFEAVETAFATLREMRYYEYTDEARQLTVSYLQKGAKVQVVAAHIPTVTFKVSKESGSLEEVLGDAANAFEAMTHAPFTTSIQEAMLLLNQMEKDQDPRLGQPIVLGDGNGRVMMSTSMWSGITLVYLPRSDIEGMPDMKYWFGIYNFLPI